MCLFLPVVLERRKCEMGKMLYDLVYIPVQALVSRAFLICWQFAQPLLFGLIGAEVNLSNISPSLVGKLHVFCSEGFEYTVKPALRGGGSLHPLASRDHLSIKTTSSCPNM